MAEPRSPETGKKRRGLRRARARREPEADAEPTLRVGASSCLLGAAVRWDGGHKRDSFLTDDLAPFVEWVPVCPEVEAGMGVPREAIRLVRRGEAVRVEAERGGRDHTQTMERWARHWVREFGAHELSGFVLKARSPSCGVARVDVWTERGVAEPTGQGVFAAILQAALPGLPIEDEQQLADPALRDNWIERIYAYRRLRACFAGHWTLDGLAGFHRAHALQLESHAPAGARALEGLVADREHLPRRDLRERYERGFMEVLGSAATRRRHRRVLHHAQAELRAGLDVGDRAELAESIDSFLEGESPRLVALALIRHHVRRLGVASLQGQRYFDPEPDELLLRNRF